MDPSKFGPWNLHTLDVVCNVVGKERLELSLREELEPKSSASTNSATHPGFYFRRDRDQNC